MHDAETKELLDKIYNSIEDVQVSLKGMTDIQIFITGTKQVLNTLRASNGESVGKINEMSERVDKLDLTVRKMDAQVQQASAVLRRVEASLDAITRKANGEDIKPGR